MQEFVLDDAWRKNKNKYYYPLVGAIYSDNLAFLSPHPGHFFLILNFFSAATLSTS